MRSIASITEANSGLIPSSLIWPLRLFMGFTFLYAGIQHLTDASFFDPSKPGFIGRLISEYAIGSPIHGFLIGTVEPSAVTFGYTVAVGESLIGIAILAGFLFRLAAFAGLVLNLMFFLSATWNAFPFYFGSDIVFVMCWLTLLLSGPQIKSSVDGALATRYQSLSWLVMKNSRAYPTSANMNPPPKAGTIEAQAAPVFSSKALLYPKQVREIDRAFDQIKRQFVLHREAQTTLEFMRALVISLGVDRNDTIRLLGILQNIVNRRPTEGATTRLGSSAQQ